jgi:hypothetical protein
MNILGESSIILSCPISFLTVNVRNGLPRAQLLGIHRSQCILNKTYDFRNNGRGLYTADLSNEVEEAALSAFIV